MVTETVIMRKRRRLPWWAWLILVPLALIVLLILFLNVLPVQADPVLPEDEWGVGSANVEPSWTGLLRQWPDAPEIDPALANLGYRLFFDPLLSGENTYSCAHCHHPDLGFADGQPVAVGENGDELHRHAMTLWNVAFNGPLFWDGRVDTLEQQLVIPITAANEMNQDLDALVEELQGVDEYVALFEAQFADGITFDNVAAALAGFQRTLISDGSAFDRYAAGEFEALTAQQRRGLGILRSAATRCSECHGPALFGDQRFVVTGVPDNGSDDRGAGAVVEEQAMDYAFRIPTLRNAVLSGPYMHNGHFATLEAVITFYADGGGRGLGMEPDGLDRFVAQGFHISDQERDDLIAFLYALVDETLPEHLWDDLDYVDAEGRVIIPAAVPSGLNAAIVQPQENPARDTAAALSLPPFERPGCERSDQGEIVVQAGQTIQQAVDCAQPGDTVLVPPGVYHERVIVDSSGITLRGLVEAEPDACPVSTGGEEPVFPAGDERPAWPVLDGDLDSDGASDLTDGVIASGNDFLMEYFIVQNYTGNGVLVEGVNGVTLRHLFTDNTAIYGLYPVRSDNVLIECSVATKVTDAAIYVGQSRGIVVRNNLAYDSIIGIEIENSADAEVYGNELWDNVGGLGVFMLPNLAARVSQDIRVYDNTIHHNNRGKGDVHTGIVALVPSGTGIFVMASDDVDIYNNRIEHNDSVGLGVISMFIAFDASEIGDANPLSERVHVHDNTWVGNGTNPDTFITDLGLPGADLLWDAQGYGSRWDEPDASAFPPILPSSGLPEFLNRALYQAWHFVATNM